MTIQGENIIRSMLENPECPGSLPESGDPPMARIYSYPAPNGKTNFACFPKKELDDTTRSPFEFTLLFEDGKLTPEGVTFLKFSETKPEKKGRYTWRQTNGKTFKVVLTSAISGGLLITTEDGTDLGTVEESSGSWARGWNL